MNLKTARSGLTLLFRPRYNLYLHEYQAYDLLKKYQLSLVPVPLHFDLRATEPPPPKTPTTWPSA